MVIYSDPRQSLFNGLKFIKNMKSMRADTQISWECILEKELHVES